MCLCDDYGLFDFRSACVRDTVWGALLPFSFFLALCLFSIPVPSFLRKVHAIVKAPFQEYITLHEPKALDVEVEENDGELIEESILLWRTLVCVFVGITEKFCWIAHGPPLPYYPCLAIHRHTIHCPSDGFTTIWHVRGLPPLPRLFHSPHWQVALRPHRLFRPIL